MRIARESTYVLSMSAKESRLVHLAIKNLMFILGQSADILPVEYSEFVTSGGVDILQTLKTELENARADSDYSSN
jgi:hypothetical protein